MPEAFKRCVRKVRGTVRNAYAVCTAANAGNVKAVRKQEAKQRKRSRR